MSEKFELIPLREFYYITYEGMDLARINKHTGETIFFNMENFHSFTKEETIYLTSFIHDALKMVI